MIATGEFPTNLCAIKLLTELVTNQCEQITDVHIDNLMPNIAKVNPKKDYAYRYFHANLFHPEIVLLKNH